MISLGDFLLYNFNFTFFLNKQQVYTSAKYNFNFSFYLQIKVLFFLLISAMILNKMIKDKVIEKEEQKYLNIKAQQICITNAIS